MSLRIHPTTTTSKNPHEHDNRQHNPSINGGSVGQCRSIDDSPLRSPADHNVSYLQKEIAMKKDEKEEKPQSLELVNIINDLPDSLESWKSSSVAHRLEGISKDYYEAYKTELRSCHRPFKCYMFSINSHTELHHLLYLASKIKKRFNIDCFQISIDRKGEKAYMTLDVYDKAAHSNIYLYPTLMNTLKAMTVQTLGLEVPEDSNKGLFCYYCIKEEYDEDPSVFEKLKNWVLHNSPTPRNRQIMNCMIDYMEKKCQGASK